MNFLFVWFLSFSFIFSILSYVFIKPLFLTRCLTENYRKKAVANCGGIILTLTSFAVLAFISPFARKILVDYQDLLSSFLFLILGFSFLGLIDDLIGGRETRGFKGHFGELFKGKLTTGALKAIGGGLISFYVVAGFSENIFLQFLNAILVTLTVNTFNLLDLRPGRAIKVFLILGAISYLFSLAYPVWIFWGIFLGSIVVLFKAELAEEIMLGDVGSNVLGAILGFTFVVNFNWKVNSLILALLVLLQLFTEKHSLTELIERNRILRWLDELGRK